MATSPANSVLNTQKRWVLLTDYVGLTWARPHLYLNLPTPHFVFSVSSYVFCLTLASPCLYILTGFVASSEYFGF